MNIHLLSVSSEKNLNRNASKSDMFRVTSVYPRPEDIAANKESIGRMCTPTVIALRNKLYGPTESTAWMTL